MESPSCSRKVIIIEDDTEIRGIVRTLLANERFQIEEAADGRSALERVFLIKPDLILVDLGLPGLDGAEICKRIRAARLDTPIIVISAAKEEFDRVLLLELGADDFLVKPFGARELLARIKAVLRRSVPDRAVQCSGNVGADTQRRVVTNHGSEIRLSPSEYDLLIHFLRKPHDPDDSRAELASGAKEISLAAGAKLGPYEIVAPIGAGGTGEVWKARDTRLDRIVAIKRVKGNHGSRFEQEARAIAALNHPHICQIHDVGPDYLVLEYVDGKPLRGPLPADEAVRLALQVVSALEEAHSKGILHRDLKPANILLNAKREAKLLDFGLAKLASESDDPDATMTIEGTVLGTAAYMAPEQAQGQPLDARSEIFSFGAVLYEMFSGRRAFPGDHAFSTIADVIHKEPEPLQASPDIVHIVARCLRKSPLERFQSVADLRMALESARLSPPQAE